MRCALLALFVFCLVCACCAQSGNTCHACGFCSDAGSAYPFDFDLSNTAELRLFEVGGNYSWFARPCGNIAETRVGSFGGSCASNETVCYCSVDFGPTGTCTSIGDANTATWKAVDQDTLLQNVTHSTCLFGGSPAVTTVIYACKQRLSQANSLDLYEIDVGPVRSAYCAPKSNLCRRCLMFQTNDVCHGDGSISITAATQVGSQLVVNYTITGAHALGSLAEIQLYLNGARYPDSSTFFTGSTGLSVTAANIDLSKNSIEVKLVTRATLLYAATEITSTYGASSARQLMPSTLTLLALLCALLLALAQK